MSTPEPPAPTPSATRARRHTLKVWPEYAAALDDGTKTFEFRKDDRTPAYAVGDSLLLREWSPMGRDEHRPDGGYTGREWLRRVTYVARGGVIPEGYCVMSIVPPASAPFVSINEPHPDNDHRCGYPCEVCDDRSAPAAAADEAYRNAEAQRALVTVLAAADSYAHGQYGCEHPEVAEAIGRVRAHFLTVSKPPKVKTLTAQATELAALREERDYWMNLSLDVGESVKQSDAALAALRAERDDLLHQCALMFPGSQWAERYAAHQTTGDEHG